MAYPDETQKAIQEMFRQCSRNRLLCDGNYFLQELQKRYTPAMLPDCTLLATAVSVGIGGQLSALTRGNRALQASDLPALEQWLQRFSSPTLTPAQARRAVSLFFSALGPQRDNSTGRQHSGGFFSRPGLPRSAKAHTIVTALYIALLILFVSQASTSYQGNDPFSMLGNLGAGYLADRLIGKQILFMILAEIFSLVGFFTQKRWGYLTAVIIQSASILFSPALFTLSPGLALAFLLLLVLGYTAQYCMSNPRQKA